MRGSTAGSPMWTRTSAAPIRTKTLSSFNTSMSGAIARSSLMAERAPVTFSREFRVLQASDERGEGPDVPDFSEGHHRLALHLQVFIGEELHERAHRVGFPNLPQGDGCLLSDAGRVVAEGLDQGLHGTPVPNLPSTRAADRRTGSWESARAAMSGSTAGSPISKRTSSTSALNPSPSRLSASMRGGTREIPRHGEDPGSARLHLLVTLREGLDERLDGGFPDAGEGPGTFAPDPAATGSA